MSFSNQYKKLEDILEWFESDDFDLDKADKQFEEGMALVEELSKQLKDSKLKITKLESKLEKQ